MDSSMHTGTRQCLTVSAIVELSTLRNLQEMHAENNMISTWDGVRHMKSLARLNLSYNRLRDMDLSESSL
jgi:Leucine-rich repeat (LRR) protein